MIAEAIFNSKLRYGIAIYLNPIFDDEDLKWKRLSEHARDLQTLQNTMQSRKKTNTAIKIR